MTNECNESVDWKSVAMELAKRVNFVLTHVEGGKAGFLIDNKNGGTSHWRDYMADGLEMIPGVKVDREFMHTMDLPKSKRAKAVAQIKANRAAEAVRAQGGAE